MLLASCLFSAVLKCTEDSHYDSCVNMTHEQSTFSNSHYDSCVTMTHVPSVWLIVFREPSWRHDFLVRCVYAWLTCVKPFYFLYEAMLQQMVLRAPSKRESVLLLVS